MQTFRESPQAASLPHSNTTPALPGNSTTPAGASDAIEGGQAAAGTGVATVTGGWAAHQARMARASTSACVHRPKPST